ncbi:MAG: HU family DNA-binding protein [bacterium]
MNKQELVEEIASRMKLSKTKTQEIIDMTFGTISGALKKGQKVQMVGFGSWQRKKRKGRLGRNPRTGESISIPTHNVVTFSTGQNLYDLVN